jgi:resuscitation-promoting factor RpfA
MRPRDARAPARTREGPHPRDIPRSASPGPRSSPLCTHLCPPPPSPGFPPPTPAPCCATIPPRPLIRRPERRSPWPPALPPAPKRPGTPLRAFSAPQTGQPLSLPKKTAHRPFLALLQPTLRPCPPHRPFLAPQAPFPVPAPAPVPAPSPAGPATAASTPSPTGPAAAAATSPLVTRPTTSVRPVASGASPAS